MQRRLRGFTFIEMVVIMVIIVILTIVTIPRLLRISEVRLHMAQRKIAADLRYAHEYAISHNRRTMVSFDRANNRYMIFAETSSGTFEFIKDPSTGENFIVTLNSGEFKGVDMWGANFDGSNSVIFDTIGIPYSNTTTEMTDIGRVSLRERQVAGGRSANIYVDPDTGRIYFWNYYYYS